PRVVVTLGWLLALQAAAGLIWGFSGFHDQILLFPLHAIEIATIPVGVDQIALLTITLVLIGGFAWVFRATEFGVSLRAVSDDVDSARLIGIRTGRVTAATWAIGGALATLAGILLSPSQPLDTVGLTLLITQAYAAAMVGRLVSLPLTFVGALALGILQNVIPRYWTAIGSREVIAVAMIVAVLWASHRESLAAKFSGGWELLARRARTSRGILPFGEPPSARARTLLRGGLGLGTTLAVIVLVGILPSSWATTFSFAATFSIAALSVVLLTGYVGQISLAQAAFMGFGAFVTAKIVADWGWSFWVAMPLAALATAAIGAVVGLPSLRARGLHLAVVTLAVGVAFDKFLFNRAELVGQSGSWSFERPTLFGASLGSDRTWFLVCLAFLLLFMWGAVNLRRSKTGKLLSAVQGSEIAAAALGWPVSRLKLLGFAVSAFVAGAAGALVAGTFEGASAASFDFRQSITLVAIGTIAGVRSISAVAAAGAFRYILPRVLGGSGGTDDLITGIVLIVQVLVFPGGIAGAFARLEGAFWGLWPRSQTAAPAPEALDGAA
ncbi:MAG: ABC transporter permease, partial [Acidobacteria bacterium]|nr:ABC transporter permease [Acidobacteriota bacterium]